MHWPRFVFLRFIVLLMLVPAMAIAQDAGWTQVSEGLVYHQFEVAPKTTVNKATIIVIRIDPKQFGFKLLCADALDAPNRSLKDWVQAHGLSGAINAGMYQGDQKTHVGFMKNFDYVNNPVPYGSYKSAAAFHPKNPGDAPFYIFDLDETPLEKVRKQYHTVIQNLRLIKRPGTNRWSQQVKRWSEAALGQDKQGHVLLLFCRTPLTMHDFNHILLDLPIALVCAQHLEGGAMAGLYMAHQGDTIRAVGSYETGAYESSENHSFMPLPNVLGFCKKPRE